MRSRWAASPYLTETAQLGNQGRHRVGGEATPLQLATSDSSATLEMSSCGYLGSAMMVRNPRAVAATGTADCGVTSASRGRGTSRPR